jgi:cysteine-rich repeat protein
LEIFEFFFFVFLPFSEICGDSVIVGTETCDDGNNDTGDGCSQFCKIEAKWKCLRPGRPCVCMYGEEEEEGWKKGEGRGREEEGGRRSDKKREKEGEGRRTREGE